MTLCGAASNGYIKFNNTRRAGEGITILNLCKIERAYQSQKAVCSIAGWHINIAKTISSSINHVNSPISGDRTGTHKKSLQYKALKHIKSKMKQISIIPKHCSSAQSMSQSNAKQKVGQ